MANIIRVLHRGMSYNYGGMETFIYNIYKNIDKSKIQFDFIVPENTKIAYENEIIKMGGRIYKEICSTKSKPIKYLTYEKNFLKSHKEIQIIHIHECSCCNLSILKHAYRRKIPVRILHSHNNQYLFKRNVTNKIKEKYYKSNLKKFTTNLFACSEDAGMWMFGDLDFTVIHNAIDCEKFTFNLIERNKIRRELKLENKIVYGHVGRFHDQKNHTFILDIFYEIVKKRSNAILLLIGDGENRKAIMNKIDKLKLNSNVILLGLKSNIPEYLCAMDVFLFPSLYEGLGISLIEAQASGLISFASEKVIPQEVKITDLVNFISLNLSAKEWAEKIMDVDTTSIEKRKEYSIQVKNAGYDIKVEALKLQNFYLEKLKNGK